MTRKDYGDPYPSDSGDTAPNSPTLNFVETSYKRISPKDHPIGMIQEFDGTIHNEEQFKRPHSGYPAKIITAIDDKQGLGSHLVSFYNGYRVTAYQLNLNEKFSKGEMVSVILQNDRYWILSKGYDKQAPIGWARVVKLIEPGGYDDTAIVQEATGTPGVWLDTEYTVEIYDSFKQNCYLPGEYAQYWYNYETQHGELNGSHGLIRNGKATSTISVDASGTMAIWDKDGNTGEYITVYHDWITNNEIISTDKKMTVKYFTEFEKWLVIDRECE